jgi:hypothetical protein
VPACYRDEWELSVENQLGFKVAKWIKFIQSERSVGLGEARKNEDDKSFDLLPNIW